MGFRVFREGDQEQRFLYKMFHKIYINILFIWYLLVISHWPIFILHDNFMHDENVRVRYIIPTAVSKSIFELTLWDPVIQHDVNKNNLLTLFSLTPLHAWAKNMGYI